MVKEGMRAGQNVLLGRGERAMDHYCTAEYESTDEAVNILCALFGLLMKGGMDNFSRETLQDRRR